MEEEILVGRAVFEKEIKGLEIVKEIIGSTFLEMVNAIVNTKGKVIVSGMGKSGHVARKISATMSSLGISSFFLHPAEGRHGDLGMIESKDLVLLLSNSGNTEEIVALLGSLKVIGAYICSITSGENSILASNSDLCQILPKTEEACLLNLAPTTSTTIQMVYGDALAVAASERLGVNKDTFALYHPAGSLGKRLLLKVKDAMKTLENSSVVYEKSVFKEVIIQMCSKGSRMASIIDSDGRLLGIITDGDIRRALGNNDNVNNINVEKLMTVNPSVLNKDDLLIDAFVIMRERNISGMPIVDEQGKLCGCLEYNDIMKKGIS